MKNGSPQKARVPAPGDLLGRPIALAGLGMVLLLAAVVISPALLIELGPMRQSLLSDNEFVRAVAHVEVLAGRVALAIAGAAALAMFVAWRPLVESELVQRVLAHEPHGVPSAARGRRSFAVVGSAVLGAWLLVFIEGLRPGSLSPLAAEDQFIEYATALAFLLAGVASFYIAWKLGRTRFRFFHILLGVFFFACAGEEISWGQRILSFGTPAALKEINAQGEFNLHNSLGYAADHLFIAGSFVVWGLLPLLAHRFAFIHRGLDLVGMLLPSRGLAWGVVLASLLHDWTVYRFLPDTAVRVAELREAVIAVAVLTLMVEIYRTHCRRSARPPSSYTSDINP